MKRFARLKNITRRPMLVGAIVGAVAGLALMIAPMTQAQNVSFNSKRDCDDNAVMHCGAMNTTELISKYKADRVTQVIYSHFGISSAEVQNLGNTAVAGRVTKDGKVYAGGKLVATDAITAGRQSIDAAREKKLTISGVTFYERVPDVSFFSSDTLDAYVVVDKNGVFQFAILAACGNPVKAKPNVQPKPNYELQKQVKIDGQSTWKENVDINYGQTVNFRITVKSTGDIPVQNVTISDKLPTGLKYVPNTLKIDAHPKDATKFFGAGIVINEIKNNDPVIVTFNATTTQATQPASCTAKRLTNVARINDAGGLPAKEDNASVDVICKPVVKNPDYELAKEVQAKGTSTWGENVTVKPGARVNYRIVVKSTGQADVKNLVVSDKLPNYVKFVEGTLKRDGATVKTDKFFTTGNNYGTLAAGKTTTFTFEAIVGRPNETATQNCVNETLRNIAKTTATGLPVKTDPADVTKKCDVVTPVYSCTTLDSIRLTRNSYRFNVRATASNGATITGYKLTIVNKSTGANVGTVSQAQSTFNYTFTAAGSYDVKAIALVRLPNGTTVNAEGPQCARMVEVEQAPVAECTVLKLTVDGKKVVATVDYTPKDVATVKLKTVTYDFGDDSEPLVTDKTSATHTYEDDGDFTIKATLAFNVEDRTVTSECQEVVSFETPETPEELPNTGAGDVIGIFAATAFAGTLAHRVMLARRYDR